MAEDVREGILSRIAELMLNIPGVQEVRRDQSYADDDRLPMILVNSGDDEAEEERNARNPNSPHVCWAEPEIIYVHGDQPNLVGPALSEARAQIIYAITHDALLASYTVKGQGVVYRSSGATTYRGRELFGEMGVSFAFRYVLWPDRLVD